MSLKIPPKKNDEIFWYLKIVFTTPTKFCQLFPPLCHNFANSKPLPNKFYFPPILYQFHCQTLVPFLLASNSPIILLDAILRALFFCLYLFIYIKDHQAQNFLANELLQICFDNITNNITLINNLNRNNSNIVNIKTWYCQNRILKLTQN